MAKHKLNTYCKVQARAASTPDNIVVCNYNLSADCTRARAKHSKQHGIPVRFLESRDASGKDMRRMRGYHPDQPVFVHPVAPPS